MSRHDPRVTLRQIVEHTGRIQELCSTYTLPDLLSDWKLTAAFEREMEILGEAVKTPTGGPRGAISASTLETDCRDPGSNQSWLR